ncbi:hypothetical protein D3C76_1625770 [compost metagenome]
MANALLQLASGVLDQSRSGVPDQLAFGGLGLLFELRFLLLECSHFALVLLLGLFQRHAHACLALFLGDDLLKTLLFVRQRRRQFVPLLLPGLHVAVVHVLHITISIVAVHAAFFHPFTA